MQQPVLLFQVSGMLAIARPFRACKEIENVLELSGHIVILERGDCMFVDKVCWIHFLCDKLRFVMGLDWCFLFFVFSSFICCQEV